VGKGTGEDESWSLEKEAEGYWQEKTKEKRLGLVG
jgi:hypothetical protein